MADILLIEGNLHLEFHFWFWLEWRVPEHAPTLNWTQTLEFKDLADRDSARRFEAGHERQRPAAKAKRKERNFRLGAQFSSD